MNDTELIERLERIERMTLLAAKQMLDTEDVAMLTGYSVDYIHKLADAKNIPYYKRGNRRFFDRDEIDDWLREQRIDTNNEVIAKAVGYRR